MSMTNTAIKAKILIIDDDKDVCDVLSRNLARDSYDVSCAYSGADGITMLKESVYDLVILDLKLPDMAGTEVLSAIREFNKKLSVVILTAYPSVDSAVSSFKSCIADYIKKPFKIDNIREVIRKELIRRQSEMETKITKIPDIGVRMKEMRRQKGWSLDVLAGKAGLSKSFLSEMERGGRCPRLDTLQRISAALGISVYFFFET